MVGSEIKDEAGKVEFSRVTKDLDSHPQESGTSFASVHGRPEQTWSRRCVDETGAFEGSMWVRDGTVHPPRNSTEQEKERHERPT